MADKLYIDIDRQENNECSHIICSRELIAFLPQDGFLAFEGYGTIPTEHLPAIGTAFLNITVNGIMFKLRIFETYKKDIQYPPTKLIEETKADTEKPVLTDEEEFEYTIQFFPRDLILFRFEVIECNPNEYSTVRYCIDNRFDSTTELITKYMSLLDLPEKSYESYTSREEDLPFYIGYQNIKQNTNIYQTDIDILQSMTKTIDNTNEVTEIKQINETLQTSRNEEMMEILKNWKKLYQSVCQSKLVGNKAFLKSSLVLFEFLENNLPGLHQWCAQYLCESSFFNKLSGWLHYGIKQLRQCTSVQSRFFETHWKLFFRKDSDQADIIHLGNKEFDISYKHYVYLLQQISWMKDLYYCDVPEINAIHEGKECDCPWICSFCDEKERKWENEVEKRYRLQNNIFMSKESAEEFITAWLDAVLKLSDKEQNRIHYSWPPPPIYYSDEDYWRENKAIYSTDEYISYLVKKRHTKYYTYKIRPKVEFERVKELHSSINDYSISFNFELNYSNKNNEIYVFLSTLLYYLPYILYMDKKYCLELLDIYNKLPDD